MPVAAVRPKVRVFLAAAICGGRVVTVAGAGFGRRASLALLLVVVCVSGLASQAGAATRALSCGPQPASRPFLPWLDPLAYTLAPGGDFETGATGWRLSGGAAVVEGNESFRVRSATDRYSLSLPSGSSATSPPTCVNAADPVLRFFKMNSGNPAATLKVEVTYQTLLGLQVTHPVGLLSQSASNSWQPTLPLPYLADLVGLLRLNGATTTVRFKFTPQGSGSGFRIDDFYVDPLYVV